MVILSILNGDALMIVPTVLLLFIFEIYSSESQKTIFITYLLISLILGIFGLLKQGYFLTNDLQTLVMIALVEIPILKNISKLKKTKGCRGGFQSCQRLISSTF